MQNNLITGELVGEGCNFNIRCMYCNSLNTTIINDGGKELVRCLYCDELYELDTEPKHDYIEIVVKLLVYIVVASFVLSPLLLLIAYLKI